MSIVYDHPKYYEVAFSFRDIPAEVDLFEECIRRFARVPMHTFIELGCGNSPHMGELLARNYRYIGLDINAEMLEYSRRRAPQVGQALFYRGDMCQFDIKESADFAFIALGSLYAQSRDDQISHFDSVAKVLPTGGLYLLDWCVYFGLPISTKDTWETQSGDIRVKTLYAGTLVNPTDQLLEESITLEVADGEVSGSYTGTDTKRLFYPQEFLLFLKHYTSFEFLGWWNNWNLADPLPSPRTISRPIVLLRKS
jgi:SAM-dependent methyltransferase